MLALDWDGTAISGRINPGAEQVVLNNASMDPDGWTIHLEAESSSGTRYVIDGSIQNLGWTTRSIVGTWTEGDTTGDFEITRQR